MLIDLPLDALRHYQGTNPKADDHAAYWDQALAEMRAVDAAVELVPAAFQLPDVACYHLYFTGVRGARLHAKVLKPRADTRPRPALLHFHGYSGNSGSWKDKLAYVALGFSVYALDCRGQGGLSDDLSTARGSTYRGHIIRGLDDDPQHLLMRHHFLDTAQLAGIVLDQPDTDPDRLAASGQSQGGGLAVACAALEPRVAALVARCPFLSDYQRVWEMDLAKDAYEELRYYFRFFDPTHARAASVFQRLGYIDIQHLADRVQARVLWAMGLMDTICPPSTQFAAYNKLQSKKELVLYPDFAHEVYPDFEDRSLLFLCQTLLPEKEPQKHP